jgi:transcriptional regulator NrdR family protein
MIIVKRKGHSEEYDEKKVYAAVFAAALNCDYNDQQSERVANGVMLNVNAAVKKKKTGISAQDLRELIIQNINDKDVALMFKHHLDVC